MKVTKCFTVKKLWQLAVIIFINILIIAVAFSQSADALSKVGSTGSEVREIQTRLKKWGYFNSTVDGIYGTKTKNAVIYFQKKNGLTADGVCGEKTLAALGMGTANTAQSSGREDDLWLLARMISAEARGEPYSGQVAVGAVILNRVKHPSFPNTISGVLYQPGAFSSVADGQFYSVQITDSARKAAQDALNGSDPSGGAIYFYNPAKSTSKWIFSRETILTIGDHVFAK